MKVAPLDLHSYPPTTVSRVGPFTSSKLARHVLLKTRTLCSSGSSVNTDAGIIEFLFRSPPCIVQKRRCTFLGDDITRRAKVGNTSSGSRRRAQTPNTLCCLYEWLTLTSDSVPIIATVMDSSFHGTVRTFHLDGRPVQRMLNSP